MRNPKFVDVKGIRTRYFEQGKGDPLVLIHGGHYGFASASDDWGLNFDRLSESFHVYAFDKLGMGYTDNPSSESDFTIDASNRHALEFILAIGIEKAHLVGHSRGAFPVTRISLEHPEMVKSLVIVDSNTAAPENPKYASPAFYLKLEQDTLQLPARARIRKELEAHSYSYHHITDDYVEALYNAAVLPKTLEARAKLGSYTSMVHSSTGFIAHLNKRRAETIDTIKDGKLKVPTLIVWGFNDPSAPYPLALELFSVVNSSTGKAQLHVFNQAGHYSFREHPEDFNRLIAAFCKLFA